MTRLHSVLVAQAATAAPNERLTLLAVHPDLGTRAKMTESSIKEQSGLTNAWLRELRHQPRGDGRGRHMTDENIAHA